MMQLGSDILPLGIGWYIVFVVSATMHEAAHAFAAFKLGDSTAYHGGQVTLDPLPHIKREPFGMVIIPLLSFVMGGWMFGWASAPYDPRWAHKYPKRSAMMALAGPASNLFLVFVSAIFIHIGIKVGVFFAPDAIGFTEVVSPVGGGLAKGAAILVSILFSLNLILCVFNLMPVPPLDGSSIMEFFLQGSTLEKYRNLCHNPTFRIVGIIIAWNVFEYVFAPIHIVSLNLLYPGANYY